MPRFRSHRSIVAALLLFALLFAQWSGLQHRIAHAGLGLTGLHAEALVDDDAASFPADHSCVLYDAAALGATLHKAIYLPPCVSTAAVRPLHYPASFLVARFAAHFSPRAPPFD